MQPRTRRQYGILAAALLALGVSGPVRADEPGDAPLDRKVLDQHLYKSLRDVINRGADVYNGGDPGGCYQMFRGALMTAQPLLDHRPELKKSVAAALSDAERSPDPRRRAWILRRALDDIRAQVGGKSTPAPEVTGVPAGPKPLWDRLGGEAGVTKVVDDWVALVAEDAKANFTRDGKFKPTDEQLAEFKKKAVAWVSQQTGGPLKYTGKSMKEAHENMGITDAEFNAVLADLITALKKNGVSKADIDTIRAAVENTRKDIVEVKKEDMPKEKDKEPKEPKEEDKKPKDKDDEKKPKDKEEDKKPKDKDDEKKEDKKDADKEKEKDKEDKKDADKEKDKEEKKDKDADK